MFVDVLIAGERTLKGTVNTTAFEFRKIKPRWSGMSDTHKENDSEVRKITKMIGDEDFFCHKHACHMWKYYVSKFKSAPLCLCFT